MEMEIETEKEGGEVLQTAVSRGGSQGGLLSRAVHLSASASLSDPPPSPRPAAVCRAAPGIAPPRAPAALPPSPAAAPSPARTAALSPETPSAPRSHPPALPQHSAAALPPLPPTLSLFSLSPYPVLLSSLPLPLRSVSLFQPVAPFWAKEAFPSPNALQTALCSFLCSLSSPDSPWLWSLLSLLMPSLAEVWRECLSPASRSRCSSQGVSEQALLACLQASPFEALPAHCWPSVRLVSSVPVALT